LNPSADAPQTYIQNGERLLNVRIHYICMCNRRLIGNLVNADIPLHSEQEINNRLRPIAPVPQQTEIGQGLLRGAQLALDLGKLIRELDEELAKAVTLVLRQGEDTCDIVVLGRFFLFGEVSYDMGACGISLDLETRRA
jgi:hypothetical protein